jgi:hypothetical protein
MFKPVIQMCVSGVAVVLHWGYDARIFSRNITVRFEKLTLFQSVTKYPEIYVTRNFLSNFTTSNHLYIS